MTVSHFSHDYKVPWRAATVEPGRQPRRRAHVTKDGDTKQKRAKKKPSSSPRRRRLPPPFVFDDARDVLPEAVVGGAGGRRARRRREGVGGAEVGRCCRGRPAPALRRAAAAAVGGAGAVGRPEGCLAAAGEGGGEVRVVRLGELRAQLRRRGVDG